MIRLSYLGLVGILSFTGVAAVPHNSTYVIQNQPTEIIQKVQTSVKVTSKEIKEKGEAFEVNIKIPVVEGLKDKKIQDDINRGFEEKILNFKSDLEKQAKEYVEDAKKEGWEVRPYSVMTDYKVSYNKNDILSISITYFQYTGGAHGIYNVVASNIDLNTGKEFTLKDIIKEGINYKDIINNEIKKQIREDKEKYYADTLDNFTGIQDNQNFYIEDGNIVIYFGLYEIAPYCSGIPEFRIPFSMLGTFK